MKSVILVLTLLFSINTFAQAGVPYQGDLYVIYEVADQDLICNYNGIKSAAILTFERTSRMRGASTFVYLQGFNAVSNVSEVKVSGKKILISVLEADHVIACVLKQDKH